MNIFDTFGVVPPQKSDVLDWGLVKLGNGCVCWKTFCGLIRQEFDCNLRLFGYGAWYAFDADLFPETFDPNTIQYWNDVRNQSIIDNGPDYDSSIVSASAPMDIVWKHEPTHAFVKKFMSNCNVLVARYGWLLIPMHEDYIIVVWTKQYRAISDLAARTFGTCKLGCEWEPTGRMTR